MNKLPALLLAALLVWSLPAAYAQQPPAALVRVDPVKSEPLSQTVPVIGRLVARQAGAVAARINGPVEQFNVEVGDRVGKGQVIAVLNAEKLQLERALAAAQLAQAQAQIKTRKAQLGLARQELKRLERLKTSIAASKAQYEDAVQNVVIAQAAVGEAEAAQTSAAASLGLTEINLRNAQVLAPYAGVITQRLTEAGAYLQTGAAVVRMIADETLEIEADVPFQRISGLATNSEVTIALDDGSTHSARVRALIPEENSLTRTRAVRFTPHFGETGKPLAVDQSVTVQVPLGPPRKVLSVHKDAVIKRGAANSVYVVIDGAAENRPVALGEPVGNRFEVIDGLQEGELVVVRGNERLRHGDNVLIDQAPIDEALVDKAN